MILCKDCKFHQNIGYGNVCSHKDGVANIDPVDGYVTYRSCRTMREFYCMKEGDYFQPKPPRFQWLKTLFK